MAKRIIANNNRGFKGIWIPKEIWLDENLSHIEILFLVEIDSLDQENGCYASNQHFANFFGLSKNRCSEIISSLRDKEYISSEFIREGKQIKKRILRVNRSKISINEVVDKPNGYSENRRGYSENTDSPSREVEEGYSEKGEESNTSTSNTSNSNTSNKEQNINSKELTTTHPLNDLKRINKVIHNLGLAKVIQYYSETYKFLYGEDHPNYKESQIIDVANTLEELSDEINTFGDWKELINEHFRSENVGDGRLSFFASGNAKQGVIAGRLKEGE